MRGGNLAVVEVLEAESCGSPVTHFNVHMLCGSQLCFKGVSLCAVPSLPALALIKVWSVTLVARQYQYSFIFSQYVIKLVSNINFMQNRLCQHKII